MPGRVAAQPERGKPVGCRASRIAPIKCSVAGQPEYVGAKPIPSSPICVTLRTMPKSVMVSTGISGSGIWLSSAHIS